VIPINHIELRDGRALIVGTAITVEDIVALHVINQSRVEWIAEQYDLTLAQIHAALAHYYDHREEVDEALKTGEARAQAAGVPFDETLQRLRSRR
jgi:uncharacterized protein (DUF433 family)